YRCFVGNFAAHQIWHLTGAFFDNTCQPILLQVHQEYSRSGGAWHCPYNFQFGVVFSHALANSVICYKAIDATGMAINRFTDDRINGSAQGSVGANFGLSLPEYSCTEI